MKKTFLRIAIWLGGILTLLAIILAVHIYQVTRPTDQHHAHWQLARIDFGEEVARGALQRAATIVRNQEQVTHVYLNTRDNILVFGYPPGSLDREAVMSHVQTVASEAQYYQPGHHAAGMAGCPITDRSALSYRLVTFLKNVFHDQ